MLFRFQGSHKTPTVIARHRGHTHFFIYIGPNMRQKVRTMLSLIYTERIC